MVGPISQQFHLKIRVATEAHILSRMFPLSPIIMKCFSISVVFCSNFWNKKIKFINFWMKNILPEDVMAPNHCNKIILERKMETAYVSKRFPSSSDLSPLSVSYTSSISRSCSNGFLKKGTVHQKHSFEKIFAFL